MPKIVHLIPRDGIGGVESAARSMIDSLQSGCDFNLVFIAGDSFVGSNDHVSISPYRSENNPLSHIYALKLILSLYPDILICSLWRTIPVGLLVKLFRPKVKLVFFLHFTSTTHFLDRWLSRTMLAFCDVVWGDSRTTISSRLDSNIDVQRRVISFVTSRNPKNMKKNQLAPHFVFWGRLHSQKGLVRSLNFIRMLIERGCTASYEIWGPDGGELDALMTQIENAGLENNIAIKGPANQNELSRIAEENTFYLQLSRDEGMAMSVVEAMQRSLVPIVTPVGEIREYCQQGQNAIVVKDPENPVDAVNEVISLLHDESRYRKLQAAAYDRWSQHTLYKDDLCTAANELFKAD